MTAGELYGTLTGRFKDVPPVEDMYSAIGIVSDYLATRLFLTGSDLLREEVSLEYGVGVNTMALPYGLIGTIEPPYILNAAGDGVGTLEPLPRGMRSRFVNKPGVPQYFEISGDALVLYPTPSLAYSVIFEASVPPEKPVGPNDDIPFNGLFDYIFREVVLLVMIQGGSAVMQADAYLSKTLDGIDRNRSTRKVGYRYFV